MVRVSSVAVNPLTSLGDLAYGGAGSPVGYTPRMVPGVTLAGSGITSDLANLVDGNDSSETGFGDFAGQWYRADFLVPRRIGRYRVRQAASTSNRWASDMRLQSSDDAATWVDRMALVGAAQEFSGLLPAPISARYWRVLVVTAGPWEHALSAWELDEVTTVGAGNATRLAPPAERRVFGFDPSAGVPEWQARGGAIADLGATAGEANNAASATLVATKAEHDATRTQVNAILAALRDRGILTP